MRFLSIGRRMIVRGWKSAILAKTQQNSLDILGSLRSNRYFWASSLLKGIALKSRGRIFGQDKEDIKRGVAMPISKQSQFQSIHPVDPIHPFQRFFLTLTLSSQLFVPMFKNHKKTKPPFKNSNEGGVILRIFRRPASVPEQ